MPFVRPTLPPSSSLCRRGEDFRRSGHSRKANVKCLGHGRCRTPGSKQTIGHTVGRCSSPVWPVCASDHSWGLRGQMGTYNRAHSGQVQHCTATGLGVHGLHRAWSLGISTIQSSIFCVKGSNLCIFIVSAPRPIQYISCDVRVLFIWDFGCSRTSDNIDILNL